MAKIALLIGVSEYEPGLNLLAGAVMDVDAIQRVLQHPDMGEFAPSNITVLKNPQRQTMEEAIETLFFNRQKDDLVLLYFSGHGIKDDRGRLFLATRETRKNDRGELFRATAVAASKIHEEMENSRSRRQVIILDCCFSGAFAEGMKAKDDGSLDIKNQLVETKKPQEVEGRAVLTSSTATQYSFEQEGSDLSVYTRYLVEGIEKGAADTNDDGFISVDELHEYARKKVQEAAPAMKPEIYAIKEGYKIQLAKAMVADPKVKYRKQVQTYAIRGEISPVARMILEKLQRKLGLSGGEVREIEMEVVQRPYKERLENLQQYRNALIAALKYEYPLSDETRNELKALQQMLGLRDTDIQSIEQELTAQFVHEETPTPISETTYRQQIPVQLEQELDLTLEIALTTAEMLSGVVKQVTTTENEVINVKIPAGISPGKKLRVKGKGKLNLLTQQRGDLYLVLNQIIAQADNLSSEKGINYTKLRDLLVAGKWKEADYETYLVMLQAVGENDWIREEELLNFPCTDLRTIDQLWVKYSNGRFGFSVQKKIYLDVGGKPDGKYYKEAWEKFGDRVGWRVKENWISYGEVIFDTTAPTAHLPCLVWRWYFVDVDSWWVWGGGFFSRIETCKL
jgi:curved DNA-binding protein CbpA